MPRPSPKLIARSEGLGINEVHLSTERWRIRLVSAIYWLLIFEGVLRKWVFPEQRPVLLVNLFEECGYNGVEALQPHLGGNDSVGGGISGIWSFSPLPGHRSLSGVSPNWGLDSPEIT